MYTVVNKTEGIMTKFNDEGFCDQWEDLKNEMFSLGFGDAIAISAEHGEGLSDLYQILSPHGELLNLKNTQDKQKYAEYLAKKEEQDAITQSFDIRTDVDPVFLFICVVFDNE